MGTEYLIDTNIVSKYVQKIIPEDGVDFLENIFDENGKMSFITRIELLVYEPIYHEMKLAVNVIIDVSLILPMTEEDASYNYLHFPFPTLPLKIESGQVVPGEKRGAVRVPFLKYKI